MFNKRFRSSFGKVAVLVAVSGLSMSTALHSARADFVYSEQNVAYTVSNSDLLQTHGVLTSSSGLSPFPPESAYYMYNDNGYGPDRLTDGTFGGVFVGIPQDACLAIENGYAIYTFDTTTNTSGYDISEVDIYTGWQDSGRANPNVQVLYSTVNDPGVFIPIATASYSATDGNTRSSLAADIPGTYLATGVKAIQFLFGPQQNGFVGYREMDIIGQAVPEPSILVYLVISMLGLLAYAWQKRK